jgi:hypothetical protein
MVTLNDARRVIAAAEKEAAEIGQVSPSRPGSDCCGPASRARSPRSSEPTRAHALFVDYVYDNYTFERRGPTIAPQLATLLADPDRDTSIGAAKALAHLAPRLAECDLEDVCRSYATYRDVVNTTAQVLASIGDPSALEVLEAYLARDRYNSSVTGAIQRLRGSAGQP